MSGLVETLEAAEVGSRELDREVWRALFGDRRKPKPGLFTTSLDAALALAERACSDHDWSVGCLPVSDDADHEEHHHFGALLYSRYTKPYDALGHGASPALALCVAICRALNLNETRHAE